MKKVLIVDDEITNRKLTFSFLQKLGYESDLILEAQDGQEALEKLRQEDIGYVLLDIYMPNMNGLEVLNIIKNDEQLK